MTKTTQSISVDQLTVEQLDYYMYLLGCKTLDKTGDMASFKAGYAKGEYHFVQERSILTDLLETYSINVQKLAGEWLASNTENSSFSATPTEAACRLIIKLKFGTQVTI